MPELPEAETIVRGLRRRVPGRVVVRTEVLKPDVLRQPKRRFSARLRGRRIDAVGRRGKNVLLHLDTDAEGRPGVLAVNLGMTGGLYPFDAPPKGDARPTHPAIRFRFSD